jgi:hypothetical protein
MMDETVNRLFVLLQEWSDGYEKADAWRRNDKTQRFEEEILQLSRLSSQDRDIPTGITHLYRGQAILDDTMKALREGQDVVIPKSCRLISSWTTDINVAKCFAEDAAEDNFSAVLLSIAIDRLDIVAFLPDHISDEQEVLILNADLLININDIQRCWVYDEDISESTEVKLDISYGHQKFST